MIYKKMKLYSKHFSSLLIVDWFIIDEIYNRTKYCYDMNDSVFLIQSVIIFLIFAFTVTVLLFKVNRITNDKE